MRRSIALEAPLVGVRGGFAFRAALVDRLSGSCQERFGDLDSVRPSDRTGILKRLAVLCIVRIEEPFFDPRPIINLLDHYARFSPHEDVRRECIDALVLLGQRERLLSLTFEPGSGSSRTYRDGLMARLFPA